MNRHKDLEWAKLQAKLEANTEKLWSLNEMEGTGDEPDVAKCMITISGLVPNNLSSYV